MGRFYLQILSPSVGAGDGSDLRETTGPTVIVPAREGLIDWQAKERSTGEENEEMTKAGQ